METENASETKTEQPISPSHPKKTATRTSVVREWVVTIALALVFAAIIRFAVVEPFVVVGASMDPTFATGQFLLVDRVSYRFEAPQRGDVIVFKYPDDPTQDYIKRIIGLPGETVVIRDGKVSIQEPGTATTSLIALNEPYIEPSHASHDNLTQTLTSDQYFVMGDNRAESSDSRAWGPLPAELIVGRPIVRLIPLNEISVFPGAYHQN